MRCISKTKSGLRCKNHSEQNKSYCVVHSQNQNQINSIPSQNSNVECKTLCEGITNRGLQCKKEIHFVHFVIYISLLV